MTLEERESKFIDEMYSTALDNYDADMLDEFADYWLETNRSKTKLRFEGQKFFDMNRRLRTWYRNKTTNFGRAKNIKVNEHKTVSATDLLKQRHGIE